MKQHAFPLRVRIPLLLLAMAFPMLLILLAADLYAFRSRQQEMLQAMQQVAGYAVEQNNSMLDSITSTVANYAVSSSSPDNMQYLADESQRVFAKVELKNWIQNSVMRQYPALGMFFAYSAYSEDFIVQFNNQVGIAQRTGLRAEILQALSKEPQSSLHWQYAVRQGTPCLEYYFRYGQMYYGALLPTAELEANMRFVTEQDGTLCLFWDGIPVQGAELLAQLGLTQAPPQVRLVRAGGLHYTLIPLALKTPRLTAVLVLPGDGSTEKLTMTQMLFLVIALMIVLTILTLYRILQTTVTRPLDMLVNAMERVQGNDLGYRISSSGSAPEFRAIGSAFNRMMDKIEQLTAEIYTRELEIQKARLRNLQMQINPHFLSNCFNVIYSAAVPQNWELVRAMTAHLASYFRFMNNLTGDEILLEEELSYTREFLAIQELRFPNKFSWEIAAPDYLGRARVPPLVVKTFAENALKHALRDGAYMELLIEAEMETSDAGSRLQLHISDTGPGFPAEVLVRWQAGEPISRDGIHHIGLDNLRGRLQLTYGGRADMRLENLPGGGCAAHLSIPLDL